MRKVFFINGGRIPFVKSNTTYKNHSSHELITQALKGVCASTGIKDTVDGIFIGNVMQEPKNANIARDALLSAGLPPNIPAASVSMACISSNLAASNAIDSIKTNQGDVYIAGGVETFSDLPIRFSKPIRQKLIRGQKIYKQGKVPFLRHMLRDIKLSHLAPESISIKNFITDEIMGHYSDRTAEKWGVSRQDQDEFALRSHRFAKQAHEDGLYDEELFPYFEKSNDPNALLENGIQETDMTKIGSLRPAFRKNGSHTAANSSYLSDGASAAVFCSENYLIENELTPKAIMSDYVFTGADPYEELLLGPAHSIIKLLKRNKLSLSDIGVFEIHEAFAGQVLANICALQSQSFCGGTALGEIPLDKTNLRGGSLSLGHPFGATGTRLITTAGNRLRDENHEWAVVAACADGGLGYAALMKKV